MTAFRELSVVVSIIVLKASNGASIVAVEGLFVTPAFQRQGIATGQLEYAATVC